MDGSVPELAESSRQRDVVLWQQERRGQDQIRYSMREQLERTLGGFGKDQFGPEPAHNCCELSNPFSVVLDGKNHRHRPPGQARTRSNTTVNSGRLTTIGGG